MVMTEAEIRRTAEEYSNVGVAYENAVNACVNLVVEKKRYEEKPGFFAKRRISNRAFDAEHFIRVFVSVYTAVKRHDPDDYDVDEIIDMFASKAKRIVQRTEIAERRNQVVSDLFKVLNIEP